MNSPKKKSSFKYFVIGLLVFGGLLGYWGWQKGRKPSIKYKSITLQKGDLAVVVLSTGTVNPENRLNIQSPIAGRAESVLVEQGNSVKKGQVLVWVSSTERAALLDAARSNGNAEEVKKWEDLYKPTPVLAPVSGMIIQRNIQPGQTFLTSDAVLVMSDHLIVQAQVDETDIAQVHLKQDAVIVLDAYPAEKVPGHVERIAFDAKTVNNVTTYEVDVLPNEVPKFMRSGMTANVTFPIGTKSGVVVAPADAIKTKDGKPYVLVPGKTGPNGEPPHRDITLGISDGKRVEISSGLSEGEVVLEPEVKLLGAPKNSSPFGGVPGAGGGGGKH